MAAKRKTPAKAKASAKPAPVAKASARSAKSGNDLVANFIAYAQENPGMAVVGVIVVLVAFVLLFK